MCSFQQRIQGDDRDAIDKFPGTSKILIPLADFYSAPALVPLVNSFKSVETGVFPLRRSLLITPEPFRRFLNMGDVYYSPRGAGGTRYSNGTVYPGVEAELADWVANGLSHDGQCIMAVVGDMCCMV